MFPLCVGFFKVLGEVRNIGMYLKLLDCFFKQVLEILFVWLLHEQPQVPIHSTLCLSLF